MKNGDSKCHVFLLSDGSVCDLRKNKKCRQRKRKLFENQRFDAEYRHFRYIITKCQQAVFSVQNVELMHDLIAAGILPSDSFLQHSFFCSSMCFIHNGGSKPPPYAHFETPSKKQNHYCSQKRLEISRNRAIIIKYGTCFRTGHCHGSRARH